MAQKAYSIEDGNLQSKSIITTRQKVYKDLDLTFARAANNDVFKKNDAAAVKQSVKNILLTNKLEKPFNPTFGGNLNDFLFELSEDFDEEVIEDTVKRSIQVFEPRARIIEVVATLQPDINDVKVTVKFQVVNTSEEVVLNVSLARLR